MASGWERDPTADHVREENKVLKLVGLRQKSSERTGRCACRSIVCSCLTRASLSAAAADEAEAEEEEADEKQTIDISRGKH